MVHARARGGDAQPRDPAHVAYEAAVANAAVKQPSFRVELKTIPATTSTVNVVSFGRAGDVPNPPRPFDIWAALPDQLRDACKGASNPTRRLQEILGLPPLAAPNRVVRELRVQRDALVRPCVAGGDLGTPYCEFRELPGSASSAAPPAASAAPPAPLASGSAAPSAAGSAPSASAASSAASATPSGGALPATDRAYEDLHFLTKQMWDSYREGFAVDGRSAGDYPYTASIHGHGLDVRLVGRPQPYRSERVRREAERRGDDRQREDAGGVLREVGRPLLLAETWRAEPLLLSEPWLTLRLPRGVPFRSHGCE